MADPTEKPRRTKRARPPSLSEQYRHTAATGDLDGLLRLITEQPCCLLGPDEPGRLLLQAIEVRAKQDPARFADELFTRLFAFASYLLLRAQMYTASRIAQHDRDRGPRGLPDLADPVLERCLARLLELQTHVAELSQAQASTARLWELTRQKKQENDQRERAARKRREPASENGALNGHTESANGHPAPANRLLGLFDGLGEPPS
jgi:hypothetical protein